MKANAQGGVFCPSPKAEMKLWNSHPKVYLDVARTGEAVCEGLLNKQIAYELSVSEATIKAHVTAIFRKLNVRTRTQAALLLQQLESISSH